ncbi:glycosyltransferase, partial [bacterium]|nr:glycosyltransferase [bacterium]
MQLRVLAMIPTYNERENIVALMTEILALSDDFGVLVVDDDSPDGTAEAVARFAENYDEGRVNLLLRKEKRGRGYAGIAGFIKAVRLAPEFVVEMDADFSHRPEYIPQFLAVLGDADLLINAKGGDAGV